MPIDIETVFSRQPKMWWEGNRLHLECAPFARIMTLLSYSKSFSFYPESRKIGVEQTLLWFIKSRKIINFDEIKDVTIRYESQSATSVYETFTLVLAFADPQRNDMDVFKFQGNREQREAVILPDPQIAQTLFNDEASMQKRDANVMHQMVKRLIFPKAGGTFTAKTDANVGGAVWSDVPNRAKGYDAAVERQSGSGSQPKPE